MDDRLLLRPKLLYFALNCLCYSTYTFTAKYFAKVWGISNSDFGFILVLCALSFTGSVFWNMLADRTGSHKRILLGATIAYATFFLLLRTEAFISSPYRIRLAFVSFCYGASNFCASALFPLLDNRMFVLLSSDTRFSKSLFGRQRLFGSLGQSFITVLLGALIKDDHFEPIFYALFASTLAFCLLVLISIPNHPDKRLCVEGDSSTKVLDKPPLGEDLTKLSFKAAVYRLVLSTDYMVFMLVILFASASRSVVGNYLPQYLNTYMKLSELRYSVMMQARLVTELAVFFLGKQMLELFGVQWMLFIGQVTGFLRVSAYAILPPRYPWTFAPLVVELLKGINNACMVSAGARLAHDSAPQGAAATGQGLFSGIHSNLSTAAGGIICVIVLRSGEEVGKSPEEALRYLFQCTAFISLGGILLYTTYRGVLRLWRSSSPTPPV